MTSSPASPTGISLSPVSGSAILASVLGMGTPMLPPRASPATGGRQRATGEAQQGPPPRLGGRGPRVGAGDGHPDAPLPRLTREGRVEVRDGRGLGEPVPLEERSSGLLLEGALEGHRQGRAAGVVRPDVAEAVLEAGGGARVQGR